jgi:hypothetical protein
MEEQLVRALFQEKDGSERWGSVPIKRRMGMVTHPPVIKEAVWPDLTKLSPETEELVQETDAKCRTYLKVGYDNHRIPIYRAVEE